MIRARELLASCALLLALPVACEDAPSTGTLGSPCNIDEQCSGRLFCDIDDLGRQCTALCTADEQCADDAPTARCVVGTSWSDAGNLGHCVLPCEADDACPEGAVCAAAGWCARDRGTRDVLGRPTLSDAAGAPATGGASGADASRTGDAG